MFNLVIGKLGKLEVKFDPADIENYRKLNNLAVFLFESLDYSHKEIDDESIVSYLNEIISEELTVSHNFIMVVSFCAQYRTWLEVYKNEYDIVQEGDDMLVFRAFETEVGQIYHGFLPDVEGCDPFNWEDHYEELLLLELWELGEAEEYAKKALEEITELPNYAEDDAVNIIMDVFGLAFSRACKVGLRVCGIKKMRMEILESMPEPKTPKEIN